MTRRKAPSEKLKPGPKPGSKRNREADPVAALHPAAMVPPVVALTPPNPRDALQRHRNMALMSEGELREYAMQVGVNRRDAQTLEVGRLRQNCALVLQTLIDEL